MTMTTPTHASRQAEVFRCNHAKGWYDKPVTFGEAMMMLVTEIDEAKREAKQPYDEHKVAAELADVYIRMLDNCQRFGINLDMATDIYKSEWLSYYPPGFNSACWDLVGVVVELVEAYRRVGLGGSVAPPEIQRLFAKLWFRLQHTCQLFEFNLDIAFDRKMAINWTRPHRHGGKHL